MRKNLPTILAVSLLLTGCQSMSKDECLLANWESIGYEDGSSGLAAGHIRKHREDCAKHGVAPNLEGYNRGRDNGLLVYCQANNGFLQGRRGATYKAVCPQSLEREFLSAYKDGKAIGDSERNLASLRKQLRNREYRHAEVLTIMDESNFEARIISDESTAEERAILLADQKDLNHEKELLDKEIHHLQEDVNRVMYRIEVLVAESRYL